MRRKTIWWLTGGALAALAALLALAAVVLQGASATEADGPSDLAPAETPLAPTPAETPLAPEAPAPAPEPPQWERPRFEEKRKRRLQMVRDQMAARDVSHPEVLAAMRHVPRHRFVPPHNRELAYADRPLPIGHRQTISQPYIVAKMTELLQVEPGDRVLEIGTGSGYQAAVLSELTPYVYTIEIIEDLAEQAKGRLKELGYRTIRVRQGDGYYGWEEHAPFDAIIVTAAAGHVPPPLMRQLEAGGRMVIPLGRPMEVQRLVLVIKEEDGEVRTRTISAVRFVPMTGRVQEGR
jgi:protein-L-isoaspartate(D-aspartate) O-methyltransferase